MTLYRLYFACEFGGLLKCLNNGETQDTSFKNVISLEKKKKVTELDVGRSSETAKAHRG
eukprot:TRINITY_DN6624_c0_g1_i1.p1 TRINITY_DN6624_c0_g1~~TRINITY_DN6624_c0_g1_i1.p1  ORF type:complete len:59 (+),score=6.13 TRINITY_DN6624_c0_g1_i1:252-428(+)